MGPAKMYAKCTPNVRFDLPFEDYGTVMTAARRCVLRLALPVCALVSLMFFGGWLSPIPGLPDGVVWMVLKMFFVPARLCKRASISH